MGRSAAFARSPRKQPLSGLCFKCPWRHRTMTIKSEGNFPFGIGQEGVSVAISLRAAAASGEVAYRTAFT